MMSLKRIKSNQPLRMLFLVSLIACLNACASIQAYTQCDVHSVTGLPTLHPAAYGVTLISTQQISIKTRHRTFEFISLLEINSEKLSLVSLSPIGQKLFQIQYQAGELKFEGFVAEYVEPAYLLSDISLIYGTKKALRQCFSRAKIPFSIKQTASQRNLRIGHTPGQTHISIEYTGQENLPKINQHLNQDSNWNRNIIYKNPMRGYTLEMKSLGVERL